MQQLSELEEESKIYATVASHTAILLFNLQDKIMQYAHHTFAEDVQQHNHVVCKHTFTAHQHVRPVKAYCHPTRDSYA
jgi:hypothetical protein